MPKQVTFERFCLTCDYKKTIAVSYRVTLKTKGFQENNTSLHPSKAPNMPHHAASKFIKHVLSNLQVEARRVWQPQDTYRKICKICCHVYKLEITPNSTFKCKQICTTNLSIYHELTSQLLLWLFSVWRRDVGPSPATWKQSEGLPAFLA